jgi:hypothetical protein
MITTPIGKSFGRTENQITILLGKFLTPNSQKIIEKHYGLRTTLTKLKTRQLDMKEFNLLISNDEKQISSTFLKEYLQHTATLLRQLRDVRNEEKMAERMTDYIDGANDQIRVIIAEIISAQDL